MNYDIRPTILLPMLALLACGMAACSSEPDPDPSPLMSEEEMRFEVDGGSRVVATTNENVFDQPFMLFGDVSSSAGIFDGVKPIFDWHKVTFDKKDSFWDYGSATQYWYMGQEHSFVAIHPFIEEDDPQVTVLTYEKNKLSFTYTLPDSMENACDLLFATHRRKYTLANQGPVQFKFTHLLARINISLALTENELMYDHVEEGTLENPYNKNEYIRVHSVEFIGIKTRASFNFYPAELIGTETSTYGYKKEYLVIHDDDRIEDKKVTLKNSNKVPNSYKEGVDDEKQKLEYVTALDADEIIVMLPQEFDSDSESLMIVNYSINDDIDDMRKIVIPLKKTEWKEGTVYTYKFLINNPYFNHITDPAKITVEIDDYRLVDAHDEFDDAWLTDDDAPSHNINYGYDNGNCGPVNKPTQK